MSQYNYSISLRAFHPSMDLECISEALGLKPKMIWKVGEPRRAPNGKPIDGCYDSAFWTANLTTGISEEACLAEALLGALDTLEVGSAIVSEITQSGGRVELFIGWFLNGANAGFTLDRNVIARANRLGIELSFDAYGKSEL